MIVEKEYSYLVEYPDPQLGCSVSKKMPRIRTEDLCRRNEIVRTPKWLARFLWVLIGLLILVSFIGGCGMQEAWASELTASYYSKASCIKEGTWQKWGGHTANGEHFSDDKFTCATNLYRFGTILRVVSVRSGKSVRVVVNDRISKRFGKTRIDLSPAAFSKISSLERGLEKVTVEVL